MNMLVTGLTGFVGSFYKDQIPSIGLNDSNGWVDLRDASRVRDAIRKIQPEAVLHLAAQSSVPASIAAPQETYESNFFGTLHLLQALQDIHFQGTMLYVGSADVYGAGHESNLPITEQTPTRPLNPYAVSKVAAEAMCYQWSQNADFEIVMARPFNHIGPRQSPLFAVSDFARQIVACRKGHAERKLLVGDIDTTRDFTDVRDVVRAYAALLESGRNGEVYNICSGVERSLREVIDALCAKCGIQVAIEVAPERLRFTEQRRTRGSFGKLHGDTGWSPIIPFDQTLQDIIDYWEEKDEA